MKNLMRTINDLPWILFSALVIVGLYLLVTATSTLQLILAAALLFGTPALRIAAAIIGRQEMPRPSTDKLPDMPAPPGPYF